MVAPVIAAVGLGVLDAVSTALDKSLQTNSGTGIRSGKPLDKNAKAQTAAQDFEAVFLNSMFQQMFAGVTGDGPMGGQGAVGVWRSFLTDEYARSFAKSGGVGIGDQVYSSLLAQQEISGGTNK
ncbi:MAG TPA: rod-binding protein [Pseudolabrys sp.]|nr:rod-binding protein [Pseudolabrys sp.]